MRLTRQQISDAVAEHGWSFILGTLQTHVLTGSLAAGGSLAARVAALEGADGHVLIDVRADRVVITVRTLEDDWVLRHDIDLASRITALAASLGLATLSTLATRPRTPQALEIAIDVSVPPEEARSRIDADAVFDDLTDTDAVLAAIR
jgi:4a-hydroxytetrahydrobiopterin dehydratase